MKYWQLFLCFLQIGLFNIGGGYAAMPLIQALVVEQHGWLTMQEYADLITIAEMTPGPMAVNSATFVGIRLGGIPGALIATAGCILPSCLIIGVLAAVYRRWRSAPALQSVMAALRPAVVALIASAGLTLLRQVCFGGGALSLDALRWVAPAMIAAALVLLKKVKLNPILVMLLCGAANLALYLLSGPAL